VVVSETEDVAAAGNRHPDRVAADPHVRDHDRRLRSVGAHPDAVSRSGRRLDFERCRRRCRADHEAGIEVARGRAVADESVSRILDAKAEAVPLQAYVVDDGVRPTADLGPDENAARGAAAGAIVADGRVLDEEETPARRIEVDPVLAEIVDRAVLDVERDSWWLLLTSRSGSQLLEVVPQIFDEAAALLVPTPAVGVLSVW